MKMVFMNHKKIETRIHKQGEIINHQKLKIEKSFLTENPMKMLRTLFILFDFGCHQTSNQLSCLFIFVLEQT